MPKSWALPQIQAKIIYLIELKDFNSFKRSQICISGQARE